MKLAERRTWLVFLWESNNCGAGLVMGENDKAFRSLMTAHVLLHPLRRLYDNLSRMFQRDYRAGSLLPELRRAGRPIGRGMG
jgi:hypothetical protein